MKIVKFIFNVISLISSVILLFTVVCIVSNLSIAIDNNNVIKSICVFNLFLSPIITILASTFNINKGE